MTPDEMDKVFTAHYEAEAAKDVEAILDTLTADVEHDVVGDPMGVMHDRSLIARRYGELFDVVDQEDMVSLRRYHGEDFMVDDSRFIGTTTGDSWLPGTGKRLDFRILHVCEFRDGKISRENVWLDMATVMQQLTGS